MGRPSLIVYETEAKRKKSEYNQKYNKMKKLSRSYYRDPKTPEVLIAKVRGIPFKTRQLLVMRGTFILEFD